MSKLKLFDSYLNVGVAAEAAAALIFARLSFKPSI